MMSNTYAIFSEKHDCEIWVNLKLGDRESMNTVRELIKHEMDTNPDLEEGYVESYPFFQADWKVVGGKLDYDFDVNQILEVKNNWGAFDGKKEI
jgi:hypothetical protein